MAIEPALRVTKECQDGFGATCEIAISGIVANEGNIELTDVTVVDDSGTPGDTADDQVVFGPATLAPGESQPWSGSYTPPDPSANFVLVSDPAGGNRMRSEQFSLAGISTVRWDVSQARVQLGR